MTCSSSICILLLFQDVLSLFSGKTSNLLPKTITLHTFPALHINFFLIGHSIDNWWYYTVCALKFPTLPSVTFTSTIMLRQNLHPRHHQSASVPTHCAESRAADFVGTNRTTPKVRVNIWKMIQGSWKVTYYGSGEYQGVRRSSWSAAD